MTVCVRVISWTSTAVALSGFDRVSSTVWVAVSVTGKNLVCSTVDVDVVVEPCISQVIVCVDTVVEGIKMVFVIGNTVW